MERNYRSESQFQADCVVYFHNKHLSKCKRLFAVFNEGFGVTKKLSMGLVVGVPDLLFYGENEHLYGFELKLPGTKHKVDHLIKQAQWMCEVIPGRGFFVDSFEDFKAIVDNSDFSRGIDPRKVLEYCVNTKAKAITWNKELFV